MSTYVRFSQQIVLAVLVGWLFLVQGVAAQGVSPFGEATPGAEEATPALLTADAWELVDMREVSVEGSLVTLSPDGKWLAGTGPDREFCVWAVETLEPTCAEPGDYRPHAESFRWAPDSTAVAFTEDALRMFVDSDLHVFELDGGILVNLTDEGFSGGMSLMGEESATVPLLDMGPAWMPDGQSLAFSRITGVDRDGPMPEILQIDRQGGEPTLLATLDVDTSMSLAAPIVPLEDGRLIYSLDGGSLNDPNKGIWMLEPGHAPELLMPGGEVDSFPLPLVTDARVVNGDLVVTGFSRLIAAREPWGVTTAFVLYGDTGEVVPLAPDMSSLQFGPNGASMIGMESGPDDSMLVITSPGGEISSIGPVNRSRFTNFRGLDWSAANTVLIVGLDGPGTLIQLAPIGA